MNGSELYQYILNNTLHELRGTWEVTQDNELKVTGTNVNGSYVVFPDALTNFRLEWDMTILSSGGYINSGISPIILSSYQGSNLESWNNGSTITNAKLFYFLCNHRSTINFGSVFVSNNGTTQGSWLDSNYQDTFTVGTKYRYKLERRNGLFKLYQDDTLVSSFVDSTNNMPIYIGWYMWYGGTYANYQANFIVDNYVVTDLSSEITKYVNGSGVSEMWTNTKNYITAQLLGYIPKSGTNALSGSIVPSTDNAYDLGDSTYGFKDVYTQKIYLKGSTIFKLVDDNYICIGGATTQANGANLVLNGKGRTTSTGEFKLEARDETNTKQFIGKPDGFLIWNGTNFTGSATRLKFNCGSGANIELCNTTYTNYVGQVFIRASNGSTEKVMRLYPNGSWTWNGTACVVGSDRRIKDEIESISDEVLDAWENLEPKQYKYKSDLENDKDNAQVHYGWIAQEVESIIKGDRKGDVKNGLWIHEEWEEQAEVSHEEEYTEEVQTKDGKTETVTKTRKVIDTPYRAKGDSYGLRYTECLVVECAYLRKKNKELQSQLDKLSARLDKLEGVQTK